MYIANSIDWGMYFNPPAQWLLAFNFPAPRTVFATTIALFFLLHLFLLTDSSQDKVKELFSLSTFWCNSISHNFISRRTRNLGYRRCQALLTQIIPLDFYPHQTAALALHRAPVVGIALWRILTEIFRNTGFANFFIQFHLLLLGCCEGSESTWFFLV